MKPKLCEKSKSKCHKLDPTLNFKDFELFRFMVKSIFKPVAILTINELLTSVFVKNQYNYVVIIQTKIFTVLKPLQYFLSRIHKVIQIFKILFFHFSLFVCFSQQLLLRSFHRRQHRVFKNGRFDH